MFLKTATRSTHLRLLDWLTLVGGCALLALALARLPGSGWRTLRPDSGVQPIDDTISNLATMMDDDDDNTDMEPLPLHDDDDVLV